MDCEDGIERGLDRPPRRVAGKLVEERAGTSIKAGVRWGRLQ